MKIAVSAVDKHLDSAPDARFGRCQWFLICSGDDEVRAIENQGAGAGGGAGVAAAQLMIDEGVEAVVSGNVGPNAYRVLARAGIKVYKAGNQSCARLVEMCKQGELPEITAPGPSHVGPGGRRRF